MSRGWGWDSASGSSSVGGGVTVLAVGWRWGSHPLSKDRGQAVALDTL